MNPFPNTRFASFLPKLLAVGFVLLLSFRWPQDPKEATDVFLNGGKMQFRWVDSWAQLPEKKPLGNTHGGILTDSKGRVYFNTDSAHAVVVLEPDGSFVKSWGEEFKGGLHGMTITQEGGQEFLYLAHTGRHAVFKTDLDGAVLQTWEYPQETGIYESANQYRPTGVAVTSEGDVYVADGYGRSWIHQFQADGPYVRSFGGPGSEPGKFRTPHGIWLDTRKTPHTLLVADRENHRLQRFSLEGEHLGVIEEGLRRPCSVHQFGDFLVVADLTGRITLLDGKDKLIAHMGENPDPAKRAKNGIPLDQWRPGEFISPHSARWDQNGNLYVMDWLALGRVTKLERLRN